MSQYDEFEKLIRHQEFGLILDLAGRLKHHKSRHVSFASPDNNAVATLPLPLIARTPRRKSSRLEKSNQTRNYEPVQNPAETRPNTRREGTRQSYHTPPSLENTAGLIRSALINPTDAYSLVSDAERMPPTVIGRGKYPVTDSLVDETINALAEELRYCLDLKKQISEVAADSKIISPPDTAEKGSLIQLKFTKWQTDILLEWMIEHAQRPFPTQKEAKQLANATGLSQAQVLNWATNARKRHMKMIIERQRKPRDFLDYLFLATDREKQVMKENPGKNLSFQQNKKATIPDALLLASMPLVQSSPPMPEVPSVLRHTAKQSTSKSSEERIASPAPPRYTYPRPQQEQGLHASATVPSKTASDLMPQLPSRSNTFLPPHTNGTRTVTRSHKHYPPKNADQIFKRGKHFDQPSQYNESSFTDFDHTELPELPQIPPPSFSSLQQSGSESESDRETTIRAVERKLIQKYTTNGVIETPDGSLDGSFDIGEIDDNLFEDFYVPPLHEDVDIASLDIHSYAEERAQVPNQEDSFNVDK